MKIITIYIYIYIYIYTYKTKDTTFLEIEVSKNMATVLKMLWKKIKIYFQQALLISFNTEYAASFISKPNNDFWLVS